MSTEPGAAAPAPTDAVRGGRRRTLRWRRSVIAVVGVLALAVAGLTAAAAIRPPRVVAVETDRAALVERAGTRVVLHADQPLRSASELRVTPAATATVRVQGRDAVVTFAGLLDYDTAYDIRIGRVVGADTGVTGALATRLRTADARVYALERGPGASDRVVRTALGGGSERTVATGTRIQRYAVLPTQVAVVTVDRAGVGTLSLVPVAGGPADPVTTSAAGAIGELHSSGASGLLGFTLTTPIGVEPAVDHVLHVLDPADGSGVAAPLSGLDGRPLSVLDWTWVPGTTSLVAQAEDQSLFLIDPTRDAAPRPLGSHGELRGFVPGTSRLVVADPDGSSQLDLQTGRTTPLELPDDGQPVGDYRGTPILTDRDGAYLETVSTPGDDFAGTDWRVVSVDARGARVLWRPSTPGARLGRSCLSPNGQYLAVEVIPRGALSDDYPDAPSFPDVQTVVVDTSSGIASRGLPGTDPSWCAA